MAPAQPEEPDDARPPAAVRRLGSRPLEQVIADEARRRRKRQWRWLGGTVTVVAAATAVWWFARPGPTELAAHFELAALDVGAVAREVVATGRVEARGAVEVGSELSGRVAAVEVDYDDHVEPGQVLVRFDSQTLDAQLAQAAAALASARANLAQAEVALVEAERREIQSQSLHKQGYESHENYAAAKSATKLAEAQVDAAEANLAAQRASLELTQTQATKAEIASPIAGVVISRYVDPGQTIAASFQAPVLFVIAQDLHRVEVVTPIDEADIGEVVLGQRASFSVDAFPDTRFEAEVVEIRNEAKIVQSVVTYDAVLAVDNPELKLRPGMTASVRIETARVADVVRLPNTALRFTPPDQRDAQAGAESGPGPGVWVIEGGELRRIPVETGVANGRYTQLRAGELEAGDEVIVELSAIGREVYGGRASESRQPGSSSPHS